MQLRYGIEDRYLSKSNALDEEPGEEREREHHVSAFAIWRPSERGALLVRAPYVVKELSEAPQGIEATVQIPMAQSLFGDQEEHTTARLALSLGR